MNENQIETNKQKIKIFFKNKLKVHITKDDGFFINGIITKISDDYFYIMDAQRGKQICCYHEIKFIQIYQEPEKEEIKDG